MMSMPSVVFFIDRLSVIMLNVVAPFELRPSLPYDDTLGPNVIKNIAVIY
jgi:hypothetical protein